MEQAMQVEAHPTSAVPETPTAAVTLWSSPAVDDSSRILRKGDLVRVAERREIGLKHRDGGLGRIVRSIPMEGDHPFRYDVDFVLGGRILNVERWELDYTTADAEGLTEDASAMRSRRKRNPSAVVKEAEKAAQPTTKKLKFSKKASSKTAKNTAAEEKTAAGVKRKAKNGKTVAKNGKATTKRRKDEDKVESTIQGNGNATTVQDLYERQRREFERCFGRLERQDPYGFFLGDPPLVHDENYGTEQSESSSTDVVSPAQPVSTAKQSQPESEASSVPPTVVLPQLAPLCFAVIRNRMEHGRYVFDRVRDQNERMLTNDVESLVHPKGVHWNLFRADVLAMCDAAIRRDPAGVSGGSGTLGHTANKIRATLEEVYRKTGLRHMKDMEDDESRHKFSNALRSIVNNEAAMQGKWRTNPFPERKYERLSSDVVCAGLSPLDEQTAIIELQTSLPDSFVGLSYTYNDTGQSEGWMKSVIDGSSKVDEERKVALDLAHDDGVVRAQVQATMSTIMIAVQDRVMTDAGVLKDAELVSANWEGDGGDSRKASDGKLGALNETNSESPDVVEQPVWGIDCYTRRNITTCIEKDFDSSIALEFIEKWLLPAINACPVNLAHNLTNATRILEGLTLPLSSSLGEEHSDDSGDERWSHSLLGKALKDKMNSSSPPWLMIVAHQLRLAISTIGHDFFRVHPKGHGSIVLKPSLKANTLVTFYRGEVYPSWRWGEKMDAIELARTGLGLRPNLPDFYNMALERPQSDPRGYGLLFVDGSRKAGHGSSLSHSCDPTCEVRVSSVNGQLCLAMTTLREVELGEELTFDYNAVTESLNEYQAAICLCGHGRCRGSFLHFASADCYQQVLNRNLPVAVRISNIIKGGTKQVMSEADEKLLAGHGFGTAAFGSVSFNRSMDNSSSPQAQLDSLENVPIWLRTYVADTLRYIEYERRALPIALLCNHFETKEAASDKSANSSDKAKNAKQQGSNSKRASKKGEKQKASKDALGGKRRDNDRPIPGCKPEPDFLFFAHKQRDFFRSQLIAQGFSDATGKEIGKAVQKVAGSAWRALGDDKKKYWKEQAILEWAKNGGREKARLEAERLVAKAAESKDQREAASRKGDTEERKRDPEKVHPSPISFEAADAEGYSAMEQRIQQLTQALSRVGRVLARHRGSSFHLLSSQESTPVNNLNAIHSPLRNLSEEEVVHWLWYHEKGVVRSLLRACSSEKCIIPSLLEALVATEKKHTKLLSNEARPESDDGNQVATLSPLDRRNQVRAALLDFREQISNGLVAIDAEMRRHEMDKANRRSKARYAFQKKQDAEKKASASMLSEASISDVVSSVLNGLIDTLVERAKTCISHTSDEVKEAPQNDLATVKDSSEVDKAKKATDAEPDEFILNPWLNHYEDRWKLEAAADLLLFYAHTNTFFTIRPYTPLESTPIEVYARELGNSVPRAVVETANKEADWGVNNTECLALEMSDGGDKNTGDTHSLSSIIESISEPNHSNETADSEQKSSKSKTIGRCKPDDIITNVTITYRGDYVLSQLLQWYNGGFGQKPGLPDLLGCVLLPCMSGCWNGKTTKSKKLKATRYASEVRPLLLDWIQDPRKRGSPFPEQISAVFSGYSLESTWEDDSCPLPPMGSPILDLLVAGDDSSLRKIAVALSANMHSTDRKSEIPANDLSVSTTYRLQSSVDEGMPAQAVANWVQCENPNCLKWRKVPWHVDVDALPETFFCLDNKWDSKANTCEAPEDTWDQLDEQLSNNGIEKGSDAVMIAAAYDEHDQKHLSNKADAACTVDEKQFDIGARFDVIRTGKHNFSTGIVMNKDFSSSVKRVLFHFPKTKTKYDEWVEIGSSRIAPLNTKQDPNSKQKKSKNLGKSQARTIGDAAKDSVPETSSTGKKVQANKAYPTLEGASCKPPLLRVFQQAASKTILEVRTEKASPKKFSHAKLATVAPHRTGAVMKEAVSFFETGSASVSSQIAQVAAAFSPCTLVSQQMSTTNPVDGDRPHQIVSVPRGLSDGPTIDSKEQRSSIVSKSPYALVSQQMSTTNPVDGDRPHQIVSVPRKLSDGPTIALREQRSSSVRKSLGTDDTVRMPEREKFTPRAVPMTSVAIPRKVSVQGNSGALIGRIPRKNSPASPSPRYSEASRVGVPNGIHHVRQFLPGVKTIGSPEMAVATRNDSQYAATQPLPSNRPTPTAFDATTSVLTIGMHRPLRFSVGMYPDRASAVPQHDGRFGPTQFLSVHREDQMSRPANWQSHGFPPKYGGQPSRKQYDNPR